MDTEIKKVIEAAFAELQEACEAYDGAQGSWARLACNLLDKIVATATRQEKEHRKSVGGKYKSTIKLAARYFAVRATQADYRHLAPRAALARVATLREDYQIGAMLGALLTEKRAFPGHAAVVRRDRLL